MGVTMRELSNPRRNVSEPSRSVVSGEFMTCLCGRVVEPTEKSIKAHRPKFVFRGGDRLSRKARKAVWCEVPVMIAKAQDAGLAAIL